MASSEGLRIAIYFFFFSSRRRHTRLVSDWSSDVCSSDLDGGRSCCPLQRSRSDGVEHRRRDGPRSEERRVGKSVDLGGRRIIKKKKNRNENDAQKARMCVWSGRRDRSPDGAWPNVQGCNE